MSKILERWEKFRKYAGTYPASGYIASTIGLLIFIESLLFAKFFIKPYVNPNDFSMFMYENAVIHYVIIFPIFIKLFDWGNSNHKSKRK